MRVKVINVYNDATEVFEGQDEGEVLAKLQQRFDWLGQASDLAQAVTKLNRAQAYIAQVEQPAAGAEAPEGADPMEKRAGVGGAEKGRVHTVLPFGAERDGKIKVRSPETGEGKWVELTSGKTMAPNPGKVVPAASPKGSPKIVPPGEPASALHPEGVS